MTPNLFLATQTLFSPHKWFSKSRGQRPIRKTEHWESPVPGLYEYIPGRGWYLIATDKNAGSDGSALKSTEGGPVTSIDSVQQRDFVKMARPVPVRYSRVLKEYLLVPDYELRKKYGKIDDGHGKQLEVGFFKLNDGVAWVQCWDEEGEFIPGPYKLWCIDSETKEFRHMLRGDDPNYIRSQTNSRNNSFEGQLSPRRRSQESRSTEYRSGPGSIRDGLSVPSTRANSVKALTSSNPSSRVPSQANSRRSSPKRSQGVPFEEAKAALRKMAKEQEAAKAAAPSSSRGASEENLKRGRTAVRVVN